MRRGPPRATRTATPVPYTTLFRSRERVVSTPGFRDPWYGGWYGRGFYRPVIVRGRHGRRYVTGWHDPFMWGGFGGGWDNQVSSYTVYTSDLRSEEHTSELQSLMRISYAVFCLKKKKTKNEPA